MNTNAKLAGSCTLASPNHRSFKSTSALLIGLAISGLGLMETPTLAQAPVPVQASTLGQTPGTDAKGQADELLRRARVAMKGGNLALADRYIGQAEAFSKKTNVSYEGFLNRFSDSPEKARRELTRLQQSGVAQAGQTTQPGRLPNEAVQQAATLAPSGAAGGMASPQHQIQARSMMAQARAAFDRGDLPLSENLVKQAKTLNVPQQAYAGGDSPWELGMRIDKQRQLTGGVIPAAATTAGKVSPAIYDPSSDRTFVRPAAAEEAIPPVNALAQQLQGLNPLTQQPPPVSLQGDPTPVINNLINRGQSVISNGGQVISNGGNVISNAPSELFDGTNGQSISPAPPATYQEVPVTSYPQPAAQAPYSVLPSPTAEPSRSYVSPEAGTQVIQGAPANNGFSVLPAQDLIRMGEQSLLDKKIEEARDYFRQAWAMKDSLDATTKQRLQDHLQLLRGDSKTAEKDEEETAEEREERARINRFIADVQREQASIARDVRTAPKAAWESMKTLRDKVQDNDLPPEVRRPLLSRLEEAVRKMENFIDSNRAQIELDERNRDVIALVDRERIMRVETENKLATMVEDFNQMMDQKRFSEAFVLAKQAREIRPHDVITESMIWKSRFAERLFVESQLRERRERMMEFSLDAVHPDTPIGYDERYPMQFPKKWDELMRRRQGLLSGDASRFSEEEQEIQAALRKKVRVQFDKAPLSEVIDTLGKMTGVNVFLDIEGLAAEGVTSDTPVTMNLSNEISLRSVLNLILSQHRLGYVIQDEVLRITSEQARAGDVYIETYYVGDLVIPIPNFMPGYNNGMAGALAQAHAALGYGPGGWASNRNNGRTPLVIAQTDDQNQNVASPMALGQLSSSNPIPGLPTSPPPAMGGFGGATGADFQSLMNLITSTVSPNSWDEVGGPGAIESFEGNLSLVISNTQEVHDEIKDLLEQLRRLQDLQVTIEVRFVTLQDNFFERIGVDFDFNIEDGSGFTSGDVDGTNAGSSFSEDGSDITIGLDPNGNPTLDLDLQFSQSTFGSAIPAFGGFDPGAAANFGFAILSDIEAYFVIQAIQGDTRTNVMQAPKVTMFNGQFASINDTSQRPFVTSVVPVVGDFAVAQQPIILVLAEGTQLSVQAVVSSDRRFVRLTMLPMFSQIGDVDTFTFEGQTSSNTGSSTETDPDTDTTTTNNANETFTRGTTVQLPNFAQTSVSTTVSVPDGGTVLMGGIKRLAEGRNERGMPILSKLPYINRLFKNVAIGRETQTLMMMVTPRIIIQEEEEERVLGTSLP